MIRIIIGGIKHCGKSTVGKELSSKLGLIFADLDDLILSFSKSSSSIRELFKSKGPKGFKEMEYNSLRNFLKINEGKSFVLSLGGGTIENFQALDLLKNEKNTIFLDNDSNVLLDRIMKGGIPPFLDKSNPQGSFNEIYNRRSNLYKKWAKHLIDTRNLMPIQITEKIIKQII